MSRELLNTLFVMTEGAYVKLEGETLLVVADGKTLCRVPLHHLGSVVLFGWSMISPAALHRCVEDGRTVVFLDASGRFRGRVVGATSGNVLLRTAQHKASIDDKVCAQIAKAIVAGKLQNCRVNILRAAREAKSAENEKSLREAAEQIGVQISTLPEAQTLEEIRGCEGQGSALYFSVFDTMITVQRTDFKFLTRNRRPPRDRVNALLSFIYALLLNDCISALEGVGLDPQIGYLHSLRSGRPALALDLMEEFRPAIAERLALTLINRRQLTADDFEIRPGESVLLNEKGRRTVVVAYQKRKQEEITHPLLKSKVPLGLVPHLQARLLARHIRGETSVYTPFIPR